MIFMRSAGTRVFSSSSVFKPLTPPATTKSKSKVSFPHFTLSGTVPVMVLLRNSLIDAVKTVVDTIHVRYEVITERLQRVCTVEYTPSKLESVSSSHKNVGVQSSQYSGNSRYNPYPFFMSSHIENDVIYDIKLMKNYI